MLDANDTFANLVEEMRPYHNHIGIALDSDLARLVGVVRGKDDFYYILRTIKPLPGSNFREYAGSAVGQFISLKPHYPVEHYERLDQIFTLNSAGPSDEFIVIDETKGETFNGS